MNPDPDLGRMAQHFEALQPPRRKLRLRRWAILAVLFFAAGAVGHVVVKGAANVAHELRH